MKDFLKFLGTAAVTGGTLLAGCAQVPSSPLYMEHHDLAERRVKEDGGPWTEFSVTYAGQTDSAPSRGDPETLQEPQSRIYDENTGFTYPAEKMIENLLRARPRPPAAVPAWADVCLTLYDYVQRRLDEDVVEQTVLVHYGFRRSQSDPCPGDREYIYSAWRGPLSSGETPERVQSAAIPGLIDHILRVYPAWLSQSEAAPVALVVNTPDDTWRLPQGQIDRYRARRVTQWFWWGLLGSYPAHARIRPVPLQGYPSVQAALGWMLRSLLAPQVRIGQVSTGPSQMPTGQPVLVIDPQFIGIAGEDVAAVRLRARLLGPGGDVLWDEIFDKPCTATTLELVTGLGFQDCTIAKHVENVADSLRFQIPDRLRAAQAGPDGGTPPAPAPPEGNPSH